MPADTVRRQADTRDYFVWNKIERPQVGPKGEYQDDTRNVAVL